ncbi:hypothetical protein RB195_023190 [Necator americanus]|uniref:Uncharacterized protein n=1 Tax=Necator americanus TaxID=51031 RepID=A0ABR1EI70_NECAM
MMGRPVDPRAELSIRPKICSSTRLAAADTFVKRTATSTRTPSSTSVVDIDIDMKGGGERDMSMSLVVKSGEEGEGGPDDDIASLAEYSQEKLYRELPGCRPEGTSAGVKTVD